MYAVICCVYHYNIYSLIHEDKTKTTSDHHIHLIPHEYQPCIIGGQSHAGSNRHDGSGVMSQNILEGAQSLRGSVATERGRVWEGGVPPPTVGAF